MKLVVFLISLRLLLAPMPWGIALNHETQECGGFWAGDEYGGYTLPEGWQAYYPNNQGIIETEIGSCRYDTTSGYEPPNEARGKAAEACCQELGYTFVGDTVGAGRISPLMWMGVGLVIAPVCAVCGILALVVVLVAGVVVLLRRRRQKLQGGME